MKYLFKNSTSQQTKRGAFDAEFNADDYPISDEYREKYKEIFDLNMQILGIEAPEGVVGCMCGQCKAPVKFKDLYSLIQKGEWPDYDRYIDSNLEASQRTAYVDSITVEEAIDRKIRRTLENIAKKHPEFFEEYAHESLHINL